MESVENKGGIGVPLVPQKCPRCERCYSCGSGGEEKILHRYTITHADLKVARKLKRASARLAEGANE